MIRLVLRRSVTTAIAMPTAAAASAEPGTATSAPEAVAIEDRDPATAPQEVAVEDGDTDEELIWSVNTNEVFE